MDRTEIKNKLSELENIIKEYRFKLREFDKQLSDVINEFKKALVDEKIKELKEIIKKDDQ